MNKLVLRFLQYSITFELNTFEYDLTKMEHLVLTFDTI